MVSRPPATRSSEGKEPTEIGLRTRTLHFSRKSGSEKERQKRFTASLQPGFCDINQLYSKKN